MRTDATPLVTHFVNNGWPTACVESCSMSTVPAEEFIRPKPI
jgi:hypothetical protein